MSVKVLKIDLRDIEDRHLDKGKMLRFATCNYIENGRHIILKDASGNGKT